MLGIIIYLQIDRSVSADEFLMVMHNAKITQFRLYDFASYVIRFDNINNQ